MTKASTLLLSGIPAVVMCGGRGSRLTSLPVDQQKCSSNIGGSSIILKICESLIKHGVTQFHFIAGFGSDQLIRHIKEAELPIEQCIFHNPTGQNGTANAILRIRDHLPSFFLYHHGNIWFDENAYKQLVGIGLWDRSSVRLLGLPASVPLTHPRVLIKDGRITRIIDKVESSYANSLPALAGLGLISQHGLKDDVPVGYAFECSLDHERIHCEFCLHSGLWRHLETNFDRKVLEREWGV